jgi:thioredoxin-like negative regulator of GroEL
MKFATLENFEDDVLESPIPCIVTFKSDSCHLCAGLRSVLVRLERRYEGRVKFLTVDTFEEEGLAELFNVDGVPTVFLFNNGDGMEVTYPKAPSPFSGYSEEYLINFLEAFFGERNKT